MKQIALAPLRRPIYVVGFVALFGTQAYADVYGRLHFAVKNAADEKPLIKATIILKDSANVRPPLTLVTDEKGDVTTVPLEARAWSVETKSDNFDTDRRTINVAADTTTDVEILLEPLKENVIKITGNRNVTKPTDASTSVRRDDTFNKKFPNTVSNKQSLSQSLRSTPGIALDSAGQAHPAGEHASTTIYINGFQLPGAFQGRVGQILAPSSIQSLDVLTGGFAPEYGRETAAILNVNLKSGSYIPFLEYYATGGSYGTFESGLVAGGQLGRTYGAPDENGRQARRFGYLINLDGRTTRNALESPQPNRQEENNSANSYIGFGNFDYRLSSTELLSLTVSANPSQNGIANRTGLPGGYPLSGLGFGGAGADGQPSQAGLGQNDYQQDRNEFGVLSYRRDIDARTQALLSFGLIHTGIDLKNHNPAVPNPLPADSSIEYNPNISRNGRDAQGQGSITHSVGTHTLKAGFLFDRQTGEESYQLVSGSQAAEDYLNNPDNGLTDLANGGIVRVSRSGHYNAAYLQDTWRLTPRFTANYGIRYDDYLQDQTTVGPVTGTNDAKISLKTLSPRINLAYSVRTGTVVRASYNRLTIIPPTAQGAAVGDAIRPETLNQFDASVEQQTGPGQSLRVGVFQKEIRDQLDTGLLISGTQIGAFVTENIPKGFIRGLTVAYNLVPTQPYGFSSYVAYQLATAKPQGTDDAYNDHDQLNTLSAGLSYALRTGESLGVVFNYGSGFASSVFDEDSPRHPHYEVNLRLSSNPNLFNKGLGATLEIENLTDQREVMNFNSAFSGTRFQQGRRVLFTINGHL